MYTSYFHFFSNLKSIVNDICIEMKHADLSGEDFDKAYKRYIDKIVDICKTYSEENIVFKGKSTIISDYISEVRSTVNYPQRDRFDILDNITGNFIKLSM